VDTHADVHVAAALDPVGGLLGVQEFPATPAGYARLLGWLGGFGTGRLVRIEGTGSYGAGLARHIAAAGIRVVEVDRSDRQDWRRKGKSDPLDAVSAARAARSGQARGAPKGRDGSAEAIRTLMVVKRSRVGNPPPPEPSATTAPPPPPPVIVSAHFPLWAIVAMVAATVVLSVATTLITLALAHLHQVRRAPAATPETQVNMPAPLTTAEPEAEQAEIVTSRPRAVGYDRYRADSK
jgi:hypothetical protein